MQAVSTPQCGEVRFSAPTSRNNPYDQGMGNRGEVFMTWEGFEPGTWSLELWDLKRFELRTL